MKRKFIAILAALMLPCAASCAPSAPSEATPASEANGSAHMPTATAKPQTPADTMTTEEKVGQIFMVRCDSANMEPLLEKNPGGILMFGVDFDNLTAKDVKAKIKGYKDALKITPYIAVDEEGGTVTRVSSHSSLAPAKYESPQYYYRMGGEAAVYENAGEKSDLLVSLGINMNLAPVADVSTNPNDFIYKRSIGQDAETTSDCVAGIVKMMSKHNIASCLKHFPGYGSNVDTHTGIAVDERPMESFETCDFLPFSAGIDAGSDAVLVSHNIVTCMDPSQPASISPAVHDILRNELGFEGIIITDDMSMDAIKDYETPYVKAVLAGNDMIIASDFQTAYNEVLAAVNDGTIPTDTLDAAVNRIINAKNALK